MKIGIITEYYNNRNYGGLLQAFALPYTLHKMGAEAVQISFDRCLRPEISGRIDQFGKLFSKEGPRKAINKARCVLENKRNENNFALRHRAFDEFQKSIPHTSKVFIEETLHEISTDFDCVICGSDQIWQMQHLCPAYFLDFVSNNIPKYAYSASMPDVNMTEEQKAFVHDKLQSFQMISVREEVSARVLSELLRRDVICTLDPTLLLSSDEWIEQCDDSVQKLVNGKKYVLCYFLGSNKDAKKRAKEFASRNGFLILNFPHLVNMKAEDIGFGDIDLYDVNPEGFLSLIKNAEFVMTDSFHACVFSEIFKTRFYVFNRPGKINMKPRIDGFLNMFNCEWRYIDTSRTADFPNQNVWPKETERFSTMREISYSYLRSIVSPISSKKCEALEE